MLQQYTLHTTNQNSGIIRIFFMFLKVVLCSLQLHLFDQKYGKSSHIVKYYYYYYFK